MQRGERPQSIIGTMTRHGHSIYCLSKSSFSCEEGSLHISVSPMGRWTDTLGGRLSPPVEPLEFSYLLQPHSLKPTNSFVPTYQVRTPHEDVALHRGPNPW